MVQRTPLGLPYVEPADLASAYPTVSQELATDLEGLLADSGWVTVPTRATFVNNGTPQVRKIGNQVYARNGWTNATMAINTAYTVADIPAGYRPNTAMYVAVAGSTGATLGSIVIGSDGTVIVRTGGALASYYRIDCLVWLVD